MLLCEPETTARDTIRALNIEAFGGPDESDLVERLRTEGRVAVELVAIKDDRIVGHLLLSRLSVGVDGRPVRALALAPMAVSPRYQRQGIGAALIDESIRLAKLGGWEAVIVLGHPAYYPRFGFSSALLWNFDAPFSGEAFMALELVPGALTGSSGYVVYPEAFGDLA